MGNAYRIFRESLSFMRIETCFFVTGISVAGYAIFNILDYGIAFLAAAILLGTGASYAYNYITDREEDRINNKRLNYFVLNRRTGEALVAALFLLGFAFSSMLSLNSTIIYSLLVLSALAYSGLRIKKVFLAKNLFTALTISLTFLAGALVMHGIDASVLSCLYFIFLFGLTLNILGDIRGLEGDRAAGIRTIPVVFGAGAAKKAVYSIAALFSASALMLAQSTFCMLIPFMIMVSLFLHRDEHRASRISILSSFIFFAGFVLIMNLYGGA